MSRKINYPPPRPTWTCPHCGFVHHAADMVRIDDVQLRCKGMREGVHAAECGAQESNDRVWGSD
jgi:hypothetical protein